MEEVIWMTKQTVARAAHVDQDTRAMIVFDVLLDVAGKGTTMGAMAEMSGKVYGLQRPSAWV